MMFLFLKETGALVGGSGLHRIDWSVPKFEIGYWCRTRFAGHGYITEAVRGLGAFAFDQLGARRVEILCDSRNHRCVRVAELAGIRSPRRSVHFSAWRRDRTVPADRLRWSL